MKEHKVVALLLWAAVWAVISADGHTAPTLWGYTGLINIPTADLVPDGQAVIGMGYVHRPYGHFGLHSYDNATYYVSVGFLPGLELYMRVTRFCGQNIDHILPGYGSNKDRSAGLRLQLLREHRGLPALLLGVHDLVPKTDGVGIRGGYFQALYVAASKTVALVRLHAGYATDWLSVNRPHFSGPFGGLECRATSWLIAMVEHDTHKVSAGLRCVVPFRRAVRWLYKAPGVSPPSLGFDVVWLGLKEMSGGAYLQFGL